MCARLELCGCCWALRVPACPAVGRRGAAEDCGAGHAGTCGPAGPWPSCRDGGSRALYSLAPLEGTH